MVARPFISFVTKSGFLKLQLDIQIFIIQNDFLGDIVIPLIESTKGELELNVFPANMKVSCFQIEYTDLLGIL